MRITAALKSKLIEAAAENGRSLSAEVESRLERSLGGEEIAKAVAKEVSAQVPSWVDEAAERWRELFTKLTTSEREALDQWQRPPAPKRRDKVVRLKAPK